MKAVYFLCNDPDKDPVALKVLDEVLNNFNLESSDMFFDGIPVYTHRDATGNVFSFVTCKDVASHCYPKYLSDMNKLFSDYDVAGVVNWHEGATAPDRVLTIHSTGDVPSGHFAPTAPLYLRNLLCSLEKRRIESGLDDFRACTEATHWSGMMYSGSPELLEQFPVPLYDIEIGSTRESWNNSKAIAVLAQSLFHVFDDIVPPKVLLAVGGVHFEEAFGAVMLDDTYPVSVAHILPNQWVVSGAYENDLKLEKLKKCVASINGGIHGIVFHEKLNGNYKQQCRNLGEQMGVPVFKHKALRDKQRLREMLGA